MGTNHPWVEKLNWTSGKGIAIGLPEQGQLILLIQDGQGHIRPCILSLLDIREESRFSSGDPKLFGWDDESSFEEDEPEDFEEEDDLVDDDLFDDDEEEDDFDDDFDDLEEEEDDFDDDFDDIEIDQEEEDF